MFVSRCASASGGGGGVCRLHVELERKRLPDSAGAVVSGDEQPVRQGNVCFNDSHVTPLLSLKAVLSCTLT